MPKKYTSEQFWKLYEKLPQELKDALFAEETGNNLYEICQRNEIGENLEDIVSLVSQVLVGVLASEDFQITLEKEVGLEKDTAKKVAQEVNRFIFYPVKPALEQLYKIGASPGEETAEKTMKRPETKPEVGNSSFAKASEDKEKPETPTTKDSYRETVE